MGKIIRYACVGTFIFAAVIASFSLPRREVKTIAQVAGIALDRSGENIKATFEVFEPSVDQPYGKERSVVTSIGKKLKDCIEDARRSIGKELYVDDVAVLIIAHKDEEFLLTEIKRYYRKFNQDYMDLPLVQVENQTAAEVFDGKGKILSAEIAESMLLLGKRSTIKDLFNDVKPDVFITGVGKYEIIS